MLRERTQPTQRVRPPLSPPGRTVHGVPANPWELDEDPDDHDDDTSPYWEPGHLLPPDALRMGLTAHVPDGALLDFAGRLDATKPVHRMTAWVMLVVFGLPVFFAVLRVLQAF